MILITKITNLKQYLLQFLQVYYKIAYFCVFFCIFGEILVSINEKRLHNMYGDETFFLYYFPIRQRIFYVV